MPAELKDIDDWEQQKLIKSISSSHPNELCVALLRFYYKELDAFTGVNFEILKDLVEKKYINFSISEEGYKLIHMTQWIWPEIEAAIVKRIREQKAQAKAQASIDLKGAKTNGK